MQFQSTLPRRKRPLSTARISVSNAYFNPRFREGSDSETLGDLTVTSAISIHASAKEATYGE